MLKIIARNTECHYCLFKIKSVVDRLSICLLQRNNFPEIRIHFICSLIKSLALLAPLAPRSHIACGAWSSSLNAFCTTLFQECLSFVWVGIWNSKSTTFWNQSINGRINQSQCTFPCFVIGLVLLLLLLAPTIWFSLDHKGNVSDGVLSGIGTLFSLDHKLYASDYDSDSVASENQP